MLRTLVVRIAVGIAATIAAVPVATQLGGSREPQTPTGHRPAVSEPVGPRDEGRADGHVDAHIGDDGLWWRMESHDPAQGSGYADVSVTDDGMRFEMHRDDAEGRGGATFSLTDEGFQLRFDVDQSR